jgi:Leucine-rich repeat (LRR) protein
MFLQMLFKLCFAGVFIFATAVAKPIHIPEPLLERALAKALQVDPSSLTEELVSQNLEFFELNNAGLRDLTGLEVARNLKVLVLKDNLIEDISPIAELAKLRKLDLSGNRISNLSALSGFSLKKMQDQFTKIQQKMSKTIGSANQPAELLLKLSDLTERMKRGPWQLTELSLSRNRLLGLSGISNLVYLKHLDISGNSLIDLQGVSSLSSLVSLYAQSNQLGRSESYVDENKNKSYDAGESFDDESGNGKRDTDPLVELKNLPNLVNLYLYDNLLSTVESLEQLPSLKILLLSGNQIREVQNLNNFYSLERLSLSDNRITSLDGLESLEKLQYLYLVENRICDLRPIHGLKSLRELRLQRNQLVHIDSISGLTDLRVLSLSNNFIFSVKSLLGLDQLKRVSLTGNCLNSDDLSYQNASKDLRSKGVFMATGQQKKRIIELEQLISSLIGHSNSNRELGDYLQANGYLRLVDFVDDESIDESEKESAYKTWYQNLRFGKPLNDVDFPGK